ncbi:hypothetical protein FHS14_006026 [Paenibacillus baekrokdamisoli]|nr:hypothetical protein [Paenibacillus baekrokdamisoli]
MEINAISGESRLEALYSLHKKLGVDEYYGQIRNHHFSRILSSSVIEKQPASSPIQNLQGKWGN